MDISAMLALPVCELMNGFASNSPNRKNKAKLTNEMSRAELAALSERSNRFSPSDLLRSAFTPTPVPDETAIIRLCNGKARVTAVKAFSLN